MDKRILTKNLVFGLLIGVLFGCGGGSPSISVQPSEEVFEQSGEEIVAKMDILWVVDNSGSMNDFQEAIEENFIAFMQNFSQKNYDFQMAVTVTDGWQDLNFSNYVANGGPSFGSSNKSRFRAADDGTTRIITNNTPDVVNVFKQMVLVGTGGSGDERAFQSAQAARMNPNNASFFREDAHLAIIIVSDEEDTSWRQSNYITSADGCSGPYTDGYMRSGCASQVETVAYFEDFFIENSSEVYGSTVHNMTIEVGDNVCRTSDARYARYYGERTSDLANRTGGTVSSLCGNFADSLDNIAKTIIERTVEFPLDKVPSDPSSIYVAIKNPGESSFTVIPNNGTNGWTYNASANSIVFNGDAIPFQGAEVSVVFDRDSF